MVQIDIKTIKLFLWENCGKILLLIVFFVITLKYLGIYEELLTHLEQCIFENDSSSAQCREFMAMSGAYIKLFSLISILLIIFNTEREKIIKYMFVYYSAAAFLFSSVLYVDYEEQKNIVEINKIYYSILQDNHQLNLYIVQNKLQNKKNNEYFNNQLKIQELKDNIEQKNIAQKVMKEENKLLIHQKLTSAVAIIFLSLSMILIVFMELNIKPTITIILFLISIWMI